MENRIPTEHLETEILNELWNPILLSYVEILHFIRVQ